MGESFDHRPSGWIGESRVRCIQFIHNRMVVNYLQVSSVDFMPSRASRAHVFPAEQCLDGRRLDDMANHRPKERLGRGHDPGFYFAVFVAAAESSLLCFS